MGGPCSTHSAAINPPSEANSSSAQKIHMFYATRRFITVPITAHHFSLPTHALQPCFFEILFTLIPPIYVYNFQSAVVCTEVVETPKIYSLAKLSGRSCGNTNFVEI